MPDAPFLPILDRVLIRRIEAETTVEGFAVPEKYRQHSNLGIVIEIGENVVRMTDRVKVGAKVLYGEYTAEQWDAPNGDVYWIVRVQDIRGVICESQSQQPCNHLWKCPDLSDMLRQVCTICGERRYLG